MPKVIKLCAWVCVLSLGLADFALAQVDTLASIKQ